MLPYMKTWKNWGGLGNESCKGFLQPHSPCRDQSFSTAPTTSEIPPHTHTQIHMHTHTHIAVMPERRWLHIQPGNSMLFLPFPWNFPPPPFWVLTKIHPAAAKSAKIMLHTLRRAHKNKRNCSSNFLQQQFSSTHQPPTWSRFSHCNSLLLLSKLTAFLHSQPHIWRRHTAVRWQGMIGGAKGVAKGG